MASAPASQVLWASSIDVIPQNLTRVRWVLFMGSDGSTRGNKYEGVQMDFKFQLAVAQ